MTRAFLADQKTRLILARFQAAASKRGIRLDRRSQLLFAGKQFYINGEAADVATAARKQIQKFADQRALESIGTEAIELLHQWYCDGFLYLR